MSSGRDNATDLIFSNRTANELLFQGLTSKWVGSTLVALLVVIVVSWTTRSKSKIPLINPPKWYEPTSLRVKLAFAFNARTWMAQGLQTGMPFRVLTDIGELTVLPGKYANEIRADPRLDYPSVIAQTFHARFPGFEGFREGTPDARHSRDVIRKHLTSCPDEVTAALSDECAAALRDLLRDSTDWHEVNLRELVLQLVAQLSSRVFLGDEGACNAAWLKITTEYTTTAYMAATLLRMWPSALRPVVHWFLPHCRRLRAQVAEARRIVNGIVERRREMKAAAEAEGRPHPKFNDVVEWFEQDAKEEGSGYDPVVGQLILSQAAIHTTTDLLTQTMLDMAQNPDMVGPLRDEVRQVISEAGWTKSALYNMKLVDSVLKESQRLKPLARTFMHRRVMEDLHLSDGIVVPMGSIIGVSADRMWDASVYNDPDKWDGYRFYRLRESAEARDVHLVSTSPNHLAWGHGKHACAGRFFVAQEVKVALAHLLLKYDWMICPQSADTKPFEFGLTLAADPQAKIMIRSQQMETGGAVSVRLG